MINPSVRLKGDVKDAAKAVGTAKKLARQSYAEGQVSKLMDLGDATIQVENLLKAGISRATITAKAAATTPPDQEVRNQELTTCGAWSTARAGGVGVTVDFWDISEIPEGTAFDFQFQAYSQPDKFVIEYAGTTVLDTGWRGDARYYVWYPAQFPGGVTAPGSGTVANIFTRTTVDVIRITVTGPQQGTLWTYSLKANCN